MLKSFEEIKLSGNLDYQKFEEKRKKAHAKNKAGVKKALAVGGGMILVGVLLYMASIKTGGVFLGIAGVFVFIILFGLNNKKAHKELKNAIFGDILSDIIPGFTYSKSDRDFVPQFKKTGFKKAISQSTVDDVFYGEIDGAKFGLGELLLQRKKGENTIDTIFQGPFGHIDSVENYPYTTIIPDLIESSLGGVGRLMQKADVTRMNQKLIKIDDPQFEKVFAVWTKDEESTKKILNPYFRSYLLDLASRSPIYVGWRKNKIHFAIDNRRDLFQMNLRKEITEDILRNFYNDFAEYYNILENIVSFVKTGSGASFSDVETTTPPPPPPPPAEDNDNTATPPPPPPIPTE